MATSTELLKLARRHVGEDYRLGALAPKSNANWSGPWDCAEFTSWCIYQLTGALFGCRPRNGDPDRADAYSGFWADDARALKCDVAVGQAAGTKGAFLVRFPGSAIGHVAISDGRGGTVEAHSRRTGVIEGAVAGRRWDIGVLVPGIDVSVPEQPMPVEASGIVLRVKPLRMRGVLVETVQRALVAAGFAPGPIDGIYGGKTAAAVRAFQIQKGLAVDGEVGVRTAKALEIDWY
jgi:N-acetylmuramoyl-L-alanine amidase